VSCIMLLFIQYRFVSQILPLVAIIICLVWRDLLEWLFHLLTLAGFIFHTPYVSFWWRVTDKLLILPVIPSTLRDPSIGACDAIAWSVDIQLTSSFSDRETSPQRPQQCSHFRWELI
jgi:hypothetical protein